MTQDMLKEAEHLGGQASSYTSFRSFRLLILPLVTCPFEQAPSGVVLIYSVRDPALAASAYRMCHTRVARTNTWTHGTVPERRQAPSFTKQLGL